jgi:RNA polymerase sigma-70 factor (ECF subfamily)
VESSDVEERMRMIEGRDEERRAAGAEPLSGDVKLAEFARYRRLLFSIAYRMLGSVSDAEDMLQETFIRWQRADAEEIRSPRAFLVTIVSRLCVTYLESARVKREQYVGQWLPEPIVTDAGSDPLELVRLDESLSMAFLVLLERLTPMERAVFLLREVFEYEYDEVAAVLGKSEANCRQVLRRAKQHVQEMKPRFRVSRAKQSDLLERFLKAAVTGDTDGLIAMLANDVELHSDGGGKGVAVPNVVKGSDNVARGVVGALSRLLPGDLVRKVASINGRPGVVSYRKGNAHSVLTLETDGERISAIYVVTNPEKLVHVPKTVN